MILLSLMTAALVVLGVPLARSIAEGRQQAMFFDRLGDTTRFAGMAGQSPGPDGTRALAGELVRYDQVYGVEAIVYGRDVIVRAASRPVPSIPTPGCARS